MSLIKTVSVVLILSMLSGCATVPYRTESESGPRLVFSGKYTPDGPYAEVGAEFSTWGDFVALFAPSRWKNPTETGGSLSWLNPDAWDEDYGRTGRIFIGEAVVIGAAVGIGIAANSGGDDGGGDPTPPPDPPDPPAQ